jgi:hypothetical protein
MTSQTDSQNRIRQGGVVAGSAAIMFAAAATTKGLFSDIMFVAAIVMILSALVLYTVAYRKN